MKRVKFSHDPVACLLAADIDVAVIRVQVDMPADDDKSPRTLEHQAQR